MLIGLTGLAGSGKSVIANVLTTEFGFTRVKFAGPLKNMLRTMFTDMGFCGDDCDRMLEGDLKETVIPELGVTPRLLMVTLGTEWGRDCVRTDLWTRLWSAQADRFDRVVVDDVRFPNEVDLIRARGGELWRVERPGLTAGAHVSEQLDAKPDITLVNDRTLEGLEAAVRGLMARPCNKEGN
jgi:hypothetical protein